MSEGRNAPRERGNNSPITRARMAAGMTQGQLAEAAGCRQKDISNWERGEHLPRIDTAYKIAVALGCTMEDLIDKERIL